MRHVDSINAAAPETCGVYRKGRHMYCQVSLNRCYYLERLDVPRWHHNSKTTPADHCYQWRRRQPHWGQRNLRGKWGLCRCSVWHFPPRQQKVYRSRLLDLFRRVTLVNPPPASPAVGQYANIGSCSQNILGLHGKFNGIDSIGYRAGNGQLGRCRGVSHSKSLGNLLLDIDY